MTAPTKNSAAPRPRERIPVPFLVHWKRSRFHLIPICVVLLCSVLSWRLWLRQGTRFGGIGEVTGLEARVISPGDGILVPLEGRRLGAYDSVAAGQTIAMIQRKSAAGQEPTLPVTTPIAGKVVVVNRVPGQSVKAGDVVMVIAAEHGRYITTYISPDSGLRLETGMAVDVRLRGAGRKSAVARVERVGPQIEPVPPHQLRGPKSRDWGVPAILALPPGFDVRPGELVDLTFRPADKIQQFISTPVLGIDLLLPPGANRGDNGKIESH